MCHNYRSYCEEESEIGQNWESFCQFYPISEELKDPCNNMELVEQIFQNQKILDTILEWVSDDAMNQLRFRLINRSFNSSVLHKICKEHTAVSIRVPQQSDNESFEEQDEGDSFDVMINNQIVNKYKIWYYFKFLKDVAGVKVRKLNIEELDKQIDYEMLHSWILYNLISYDIDIIEEFTGMKQLCKNLCRGCKTIVNNGRCRKYGPLDLGDFERKNHFKELIVSDGLLFDIAVKCHADLEYPEEPFGRLEKLFKTPITCDHLHVTLTNNFGRSRYPEIGEERRLSHAYPREVLDMMITKWKVKSLKVELQDSNEEVSPMWSKDMVFKLSSFEVPFKTQKVSKFWLEAVEIDLNCAFSLFQELEMIFQPNEPFPLENLIANSKRLFPTNNLTITIPPYHPEMVPEALDIFIPKFMSMAEIEMKRNFNLTMKIYQLPQHQLNRKADIPNIFNSGARLHLENSEDQDCFILQEVVRIEKQEERYFFGSVFSWNGMSFKLRNPIQNINVNFEIILEKKFLMELPKVCTEMNHVGFLRHYLDFH